MIERNMLSEVRDLLGKTVREFFIRSGKPQQFVGGSVECSTDLFQSIDGRRCLTADDGSEMSWAKIAEFRSGFVGEVTAVADAENGGRKFLGEHGEPSPSVLGYTVSVEVACFYIKEGSCLNSSRAKETGRRVAQLSAFIKDKRLRRAIGVLDRSCHPCRQAHKRWYNHLRQSEMTIMRSLFIRMKSLSKMRNLLQLLFYPKLKRTAASLPNKNQRMLSRILHRT